METLLFCLLIIILRIVDVSLDTIRILVVNRGGKYLATILGFLQVFIWAMVARQVLSENAPIIQVVSYALGFALGNFIGITLDNHIAMGLSTAFIIVKENQIGLISLLRQKEFGITVLDGHGMTEEKLVLLVVLKRKRIPELLQVVKNSEFKALVTITDTKVVSGGYFKKGNSFRV